VKSAYAAFTGVLSNAAWSCFKLFISVQMSADLAPPPTYSQRDPGRQSNSLLSEPQLLISPPVDEIDFQKGYLGADGERAAVEGELQIKDLEPKRWSKMYALIRLFIYITYSSHLGYQEPCHSGRLRLLLAAR
jgi:hypothetical protein